MLVIHPDTKIYLYSKATDMRKSFNALSIIILEKIGNEPSDGSMYVFCNRKQDKLKILQWEKIGFWLHYKRLSKSKFSIPKLLDDNYLINNRDLLLILEGINNTTIIPTKMF